MTEALVATTDPRIPATSYIAPVPPPGGVPKMKPLALPGAVTRNCGANVVLLLPLTVLVERMTCATPLTVLPSEYGMKASPFAYATL